MASRLDIGHLIGAIVAVLSAAMISLAAGAMWMLATLHGDGGMNWLALPVGAALGWAMRAGVTHSRPFAATLAALATVLAALYMLALHAAMQIGAMLGLSFADSLRQAGAGMLLDIARLQITSMTVPLTLGIVLAVFVATRRKH